MMVTWPVPVKVPILPGGNDELTITDNNKKTFINDGYTIVDNQTGRIYRVLERYKSPDDTRFCLTGIGRGRLEMFGWFRRRSAAADTPV